MQIPFPEPNYHRYNELSEVQLFELFFDEKLIDMIVEQSTVYRFSKNWANLNVSREEIKAFLGILNVSGYNPLDSKKVYWSTGDDLRNIAIYEAMRRDRFATIMKCLHFKTNNELNLSDKYSKLRPYVKHLQEKFLEHFVPTPYLFHDEAMVECFGRCSCKQAIRNKPMRFGHKVWCQNTPSGYLVVFDLDQGKTYQGNEELEANLGKAPARVLHAPKKDYPYHIFINNLFTTALLLEELKKGGYDGTGIMRSNRSGKDCPLSDTSSFKRSERGTMRSIQAVVTTTLQRVRIKLAQWLNNGVATLASSIHGIPPVSMSKR